MSFRGPEMHFQDILKAIRLIEQFVGNMDFAAYAEDIKTRAAVERELQILTEAAYRLKPEDEWCVPALTGAEFAGWGTYCDMRTTASMMRRYGTRSRMICPP